MEKEKTIILKKQYQEGARVYYCQSCKHTITIAKDKEKVKCYYCGKEE